MIEAGVAQARYQTLVRNFEGQRVLVVGDLMMDEYVRGSVRRVSPESPVVVVEVEEEEFKPGGAANVVNNLQALGAKACVIGVVGADECGNQLRLELSACGAEASGILVDPSRPTTRKTRIVAHSQQVVRVDRERTCAISETLTKRLLEQVEQALPDVDAVLVSDYRKGLITPEMAGGIVARARQAGCPVIANPKPVSARWLTGADVLSLNQLEAEELGGQSLPEEEIDLCTHGETLRRELGVEMLVITRGAKGLTYWRPTAEYRRVPAHPIAVYDVAGAGDTTISALTLALISGGTPAEAAFIANHAGACVVRKVGVATVCQDELIRDWEPGMLLCPERTRLLACA